MNRFLCVSLIVFVVICCVMCVRSSTVFSYAKSVCADAHLIEDYDGCVIVSIDEESVKKLTDKLDIQIVNKRVVEGRVVVEGYTHKINNYIVINNKKINIQISIFEGVCLVGCPLIKKSF